MSIQIDRGEPGYEWAENGDLVKKRDLTVAVSPAGHTEPLESGPSTDIAQDENVAPGPSRDPAVVTWTDAFNVSGRLGDSLDRLEKRDNAAIRTFESGATRDVDSEKYEYDGFLSPEVLHAFAGYMHQHRTMKDGSVRGSDNWKAGMPQDVYFKSLARHFFDLWLMVERGHTEITRPDGEQVELEDALGGLMFNLQGYWLGVIREMSE